MSSRYVPPHLRRQQQAAADQETASGTTQLADDALPTRKLEDLKVSNRKSGHGNPRAKDPNALAFEEIHMHFAGRSYLSTSRSTLNNSLEKPNDVAYVMLFKDANPRWDSDGILFAKTNIAFLPGYEKAYGKGSSGIDAMTANSDSGERTRDTDKELPQTPGSHDVGLAQNSPAVPVFVQTFGRSSQFFHLSGFFRIQKLTFLDPHSQELARMLAQKWDIRDKRGRQKNVQRDKGAWEKSLDTRWAVIKMEKVGQGEEEQVLEIEKFDDPTAVREEAMSASKGELEKGNEHEEAESVETQDFAALDPTLVKNHATAIPSTREDKENDTMNAQSE